MLQKLWFLLLKILSYPYIDLKKVYHLARSLRNLKSSPFLRPLYRLWDHKIFCEGREILVRIYTPHRDDKENTLLFFHGGGWIAENIDTYNHVCRGLAKFTRSKVISVEYRLAPECPFPQGLEDCYLVARELHLHADRLDLFPGKITLIGDSAGGNLSAAVSLMARDRGEFDVERQILIYPATHWDHSPSSPYESVKKNGKGYLLTARKLQDYMALYKSNEKDFSNPYFAPLTAKSFRDQPKTLIVTAEFDPLRDEGEAYGERLREGGAWVAIYRIKNALHGFFGLGIYSFHTRKTFRLINEFLKGDSRPCQTVKL